jgi:hypothetical protein
MLATIALLSGNVVHQRCSLLQGLSGHELVVQCLLFVALYTELGLARFCGSSKHCAYDIEH